MQSTTKSRSFHVKLYRLKKIAGKVRKTADKKFLINLANALVQIKATDIELISKKGEPTGFPFLK